MRSALGLIGMIAMAVAWNSGPSDAHRLKVFATAVGSSIEGKAYFVGGGPAEGVSVALRDEGKKVLAEGRTDSDGRFAIAAPVRTDITIVVDALDGHVADYSIPFSRLPDDLPVAWVSEQTAEDPGKDAGSPPASPIAETGNREMEAAIARQIAPLGEQIDQLQSSIRLHDILGGVGYVIGIFGLFALLKARARRTPREPDK